MVPMAAWLINRAPASCMAHKLRQLLTSNCLKVSQLGNLKYSCNEQTFVYSGLLVLHPIWNALLPAADN